MDVLGIPHLQFIRSTDHRLSGIVGTYKYRDGVVLYEDTETIRVKTQGRFYCLHKKRDDSRTVPVSSLIRCRRPESNRYEV